MQIEASTRLRWGMVAVAALSAVIAALPLSGQEVRYNGSLQYSSGSYIFAQRTHSFYLFSGLGVSAGRLQFDANFPLILQNSGVVSYVGGVPLPTGGPDHEAVRTREPGSTIPGRGSGRTGTRGFVPAPADFASEAPVWSGSGPTTSIQMQTALQQHDSVRFRDQFDLNLGDPTLFGSAEIFSGTGVLRSIGLSGSTKVPLADLDSGVGTEEWDFSVGGSVAVAAGDLFLFGDLSHWWFGDLPELELQDGLGYGLGVGLPIGDGSGTLLGTLTGAESAIETVDAPLSLGLSLGFTLSDRRQLNVGATVGLSESSPDFGLSLGWSVGL